MRARRRLAVERAKKIAGMKPTVYVLGAGGRNPSNPTPFTTKNGKLGSDCVGFTNWCLQEDRFCEDFQLYRDGNAGWMNTDSIMEDAKLNNSKSKWEFVTVPEEGDCVVFPSLRDKAGKMTRMGHIGLLTSVPKNWPTDWSWTRADRKKWLSELTQIDCNASSGRKAKKQAVGQDPASINWNKPDARFVRLKR